MYKFRDLFCDPLTRGKNILRAYVNDVFTPPVNISTRTSVIDILFHYTVFSSEQVSSSGKKRREMISKHEDEYDMIESW